MASVCTKTLLIVSAFCTRVVHSGIISNVQPRIDQYGQPLNAHQGSLILGQDNYAGRYYYYGGHFPNCSYKEHCACNDTDEQIWKSVAVYSSADLVSFRYETEIFHGSLEPRVVANPATREYVMVVKAPLSPKGCVLSVAASENPIGQFKFRSCLNISHELFSDWSVFADPTTGKGYIIYNAKDQSGQFIEELTQDYSAVVAGSVPTHIAADTCKDGGCEAPLLFERQGQYYALFGHNCWCCPSGSELFVYIAPNPLGPYTFHGDANVNNSTKQRVVKGQSTAVLPVDTVEGMQYLWLSDRWQSTTMWSTDFQYWGFLNFDQNGLLNPIQWQDSFEVNLKGQSGTIV